jgi:hypothetical protein
MAPAFLNSTLDGGVSFTPQPFYPQGRKIADWVGPRTGLDAVEKRKYLARAGNVTRAAHRYTGSHDLNVSTAKLLARHDAWERTIVNK